MNRFKFPLFLLAMGIAITTVFAFGPAQHAQQQAAKPKQETSTRYYYNGPGTQTIAELADPQNWVTTPALCEETGDDVCSISHTGSRTDFDNYISGFADDSKEDVMLEADGFKN